MEDAGCRAQHIFEETDDERQRLAVLEKGTAGRDAPPGLAVILDVGVCQEERPAIAAGVPGYRRVWVPEAVDQVVPGICDWVVVDRLKLIR